MSLSPTHHPQTAQSTVSRTVQLLIPLPMGTMPRGDIPGMQVILGQKVSAEEEAVLRSLGWTEASDDEDGKSLGCGSSL